MSDAGDTFTTVAVISVPAGGVPQQGGEMDALLLGRIQVGCFVSYL